MGAEVIEAPSEETVSGSHVAKGALWSALSNIVMRFANIAVTALLARLLAPEDYGAFALALAVFVVVTSLAELGLAVAITRSPKEPAEIAPTVTTVAVVVSTVLAVLMAWQAPALAELVGSTRATEALRILSICVFLTGIFAVPGAQLARDFRQRRIFAATVAGFVPANALLVLLALAGHGADAFAWSRVVGQIIAGAVMVGGVRLYRPGFRRELLMPLLRFGLPLSAANLVNWALLNADYVILGRFLTDAAVGTYMIAFTVASWSTAVLGSALNAVVVPAFARLGSARDAVSDATLLGVRLVALVALPIGVTTMALSGPLVASLFGPRWAQAAPVLAVLSAYGMLYAFSLLLVNLLVAHGRTSRLLVVQMLWIGLLVPLMILSVRYGLVGVAWAHVAVMALVAIPGYALALRGQLPAPVEVLGAVRKPLVAALSAGAVAVLVARGVEAYGGGAWPTFLAGGASAVATYLAFTRRDLLAMLPARQPSP